MPKHRVDWRVRRPFGDVEIELHPGSIDGATRESSVRLLRQLVHDFICGKLEARRIVLEVHARMRAMPARDAYRRDLDALRAPAIGEELLQAALAGQIVARRRETRAVALVLEAPDEAVVGPDAADVAPESKTWIGLTLADQDGTPVPNRPYRIVKPDGTTIDGTLDSNATAIIQGLDAGNCQIWCPYVAPHPELTFTVKDGDHASGIAETYGFDDYSAVWNDPGNADLQAQRTDPHVLMPGDALTIPEVTPEEAANKPTGAKHPFTIQRSPLKLRLTLLDLAVKPMKGAAVTVAGTALTADDAGLVEATVDKGTKDAELTWPGVDVDLRVGALNPNDDTSEAGYRARLVNMGYLWDPMVDDAEDEMLIALEDFQAQYKLPVTGQLDDATKAKLLTAYGC